jgi:hypothetical protein
MRSKFGNGNTAKLIIFEKTDFNTVPETVIGRLGLFRFGGLRVGAM